MCVDGVGYQRSLLQHLRPCSVAVIVQVNIYGQTRHIEYGQVDAPLRANFRPRRSSWLRIDKISANRYALSRLSRTNPVCCDSFSN